MARIGALSREKAETHINAHLACPNPPPGIPCDLLVMPVNSAPHLGLMPDLFRVIRDVITNTTAAQENTFLHHTLSQCIPGAKKVGAVSNSTGAEMILNVILCGLFLGCYPCANKKITFQAKSSAFAYFHALLTSTPEDQMAFLQAYPRTTHLALLEYIVRVSGIFMPVEKDFLTEKCGMRYHYTHIPVWADEFRSSVPKTVEGMPGVLRDTEETARELMDRSVRVKKRDGDDPVVPRATKPKPDSIQGIAQILSLPVVQNGSIQDYQILLSCFGMPHTEDRARGTHHIHNSIVKTLLPRNIFLEQQATVTKKLDDSRARWLQRHTILCIQCFLKKPQKNDSMRIKTSSTRVNTYTGGLVCSACSSDDIVRLDMTVGNFLVWRDRY
jgi:hypothetical protein